VKLATHAALASAKLAAALSGDSLDEIGMTIAYLKRALKAITIAMEAAATTAENQWPDHPFAIRGTAAATVSSAGRHCCPDGEYRGEWRRRFGSEGYRG